ncbi:uncharacterized protein LOC113330717 [Papaver somniferum]|uniref:uncharacterized protein LOC113330717 n=1 Tax=Papaver somniferum TaxID=3469 RepID=UPI000E6F4BC8|nr:uncharacterized protein LOC113330717 [Papaver somniferum]
MKKKRKGGNIGLKLDISQAYDSVSWKFIFQVLIKYGSVTWCQWLSTLFESAKVSVMINGGPNGFFSVGRGLRQGDPLSPILFVLMEDVLSINISKLLAEGKITPMVIRNGIHPSHMLFVYDVFILCNGAKKNIQNLMKLLEDYQKSSGQMINKSKSKLFVDGTTAARTMQIKELMEMEVISLPVLGSIPIYSMSVYMWPQLVIKICERIIRNFLWSGNGETRKFKTLSWKKTLSEIGTGNDNLIWKGNIEGNFATSSAINLIRNKEQHLHCYKKIWNSYLHPSIASNIWKLVQGIYADDTILVERGFELASRWCICE